MRQQEGFINCPKCGRINRIKPHSADLKPVCGRCKTPLIEPSIQQQNKAARLLKTMLNAFIVVSLVGVCYAIVLTPKILKKDYSDIIASEEEKTVANKLKQEKHLTEVKAKLQKELLQIDAEKLRREAVRYYKNIFDARQSFDKRYALTPREKTQLRMQELGSDSTKSYHQLIASVAKEASPQGADIRVTESLHGIALHIDFDMASMTTGEQGTRTKHHTKESLRKEVVSLISRVTNDVFQFCRNIGLATVHVGCLHYVQTERPDGSKRAENTMLYKIIIRKNRIPNLSDNPFLDIYSTTQYLEVEEDNFSEIEIITTRI